MQSFWWRQGWLSPLGQSFLWWELYPSQTSDSVGLPLETPPVVVASPGSFAWTGTDAVLKPLRMYADSGSFDWTGTAAVLVKAWGVDPGAFAWTGTDASLNRTSGSTTHQASAVPATNPTTSFTVQIPFAASNGDMMLLHVTSRDHTSGDGWFTVTDDEGGGAPTWVRIWETADRKASIWSRRATGSSFLKTITVSGTIGSGAGSLNVFIDVGGITFHSTETNASGNETHAGPLPRQADSLINCAVFDYGGANATSGWSFPNLGTAFVWQQHQSTGGSGCSVTCAGAGETGGPTQVGTIAWSQTDSTTYSVAYELSKFDAHADLGAADAGSFAWSGQSAILAKPGAFAWTGTAATLSVGSGGYTLTADAGSFAWTGTAAALLEGHLVVADAGAFTVSDPGTTALLEARVLTSDPGAFAWTGTAANLLEAHVLVADSGAFTVADPGTTLLVRTYLPLTADAGAFTVSDPGTTALFKGISMPADSGAFTVADPGTTGLLEAHLLVADAGAFSVADPGTTVLTKSGAYTLTADAGAFTVSDPGTTVLRGAFVVAATSGAYAWTGTDAGLLEARVLVADAGAYAWTGTAANLLEAHVLVADSGAFTVADPGTTNLVKAGSYSLVADPGAFSWTGIAAVLGRSIPLAADPGAFAWTGTDAALLEAHRLVADAGSVAITGADANLYLPATFSLSALSGAFYVRGMPVFWPTAPPDLVVTVLEESRAAEPRDSRAVTSDETRITKVHP